MESVAHVMVIPLPAQGHVSPLMKLANRIAEHDGIIVTFVNTESIHQKIMTSMSSVEEMKQCSLLNLVSVPDGVETDHDRQDPVKLCESIQNIMSVHVKDLIKKSYQTSKRITCIIADVGVDWALKLAKEMGIKRAAFTPFAVANFAFYQHVPKLIEAGVFNDNGFLMKDDRICISEEIASWRNNEFVWSHPGNPKMENLMFQLASHGAEIICQPDWLLANSFLELEPFAFKLLPHIMPIGPLLADISPRHIAGNIWPEDLTCLTWLDKQPRGSTIYAAFGSLAIFTQQELDELVLGLELAGKPFLLVGRPNLSSGESPQFPDEFIEQIKVAGKIVPWASQEKVLSHPSVACFISHCGWNSTLEGISNGVPFLCRPAFSDQFHNMRSICETWKIGLELIRNDEGIVTRHEIAAKITALLGDKVIKSNAIKLKELARNSITKGGSSFNNLERFIEQIKKD